MRFSILTLGCKVNAYESEIMKEKLLEKGFLWSNEDDSDIVIINTCSVTNMADNKSKKYVRHAKRLNKILVVCGCSSENNQEEYKSMGIDILIGNKDKSKIAEKIEEFIENRKSIIKFYDDEFFDFEDMEITRFTSHTRAFVKIQDGCNNFCSYCIIPYVRKNIRSKDFEKAVDEIKMLVSNGHKEVVLTGIHTGSYKSDDGRDLADLLHEISLIDGLERIRISSIEITELNDKMLDEIKNNSKIVNHFHIPLQTGSNQILKRMNRKYQIDYFKEKIKKIRSIKEDVSITTDVIVGHPYETEELFLETINTCKDINFSKIHVFPYSKRDGTPSSKMLMQVEDSEKKRRSKVLNEISQELETNFYKEHLNKNLKMLVEEVYDNFSVGFTSNYIKIKVNEKLNKNQFYVIKTISCEDNCLIGELIK